MRAFGLFSHHLTEHGSFQWWLHRQGSGGCVFSLQLAAPSHSWCSIGATLGSDGDDRDCGGHVSLCRLGIYGGFRARWLGRLRHQEWQFAMSDGRIRLTLGGDPMSWSRADPWWWHWSVDPAEVLFGKMQHSETVVSRTASVVPMPEGSYPCVVVMKAERWQRTRLPWASHTTTRAHVEIPKGVPVPGKGENSWDIDDDAIFSQTAPAKTIEEGIAHVVESALKSRRRYGGSVNWQAKEAR